MRPARRRPQDGATLVELMVGIVVGMIVVSGVVHLSGGNIASTRALLAEIRVMQDLRAAGDLITRDLRRAAYWGNSIQGTLAVGTGAAATPNPYAAVATSGSSEISYAFTRDAVEDNTLGSGEQFGFRMTDGRIEMQTAAGVWQAVTNPDAVTVTAFTITPVATVLPLGHLCPTTCAAGTPNCPAVTVRRFDLLLRGQSARDASVVRDLRSTVRLRNDRLTGVCPA